MRCSHVKPDREIPSASDCPERSALPNIPDGDAIRRWVDQQPAVRTEKRISPRTGSGLVLMDHTQALARINVEKLVECSVPSGNNDSTVIGTEIPDKAGEIDRHELFAAGKVPQSRFVVPPGGCEHGTPVIERRADRLFQGHFLGQLT